MTDLWDIAAHVEEYPEDHPARWRLAKKLYAAHEYRLALEHLCVLKDHWTPKLNVFRYLAATYFRLGRLEEAASALDEAVQQWPEEVGPREQRARVLTAKGEPTRAIAAWEQVLALQPDHSVARKAVDRLRENPESKEAENGAGESAAPSAVPLSGRKAHQPGDMPGRICFNCGAQNSDDFDVCWQCGQSFLAQEDSFLNTPPIEAHGPWILSPETITLFAAIAIVLLLIVSLFLGVGLVLEYREGRDVPLLAMDEIYGRILVPSRVLAGIAAFIFWPFAMNAVLWLLRVSPRPPGLLVSVSGLLSGAVTLTLMLMPGASIFVAVMLPLFLSLAFVVVGFRLNYGMALAVWITHSVVVFIVGATVFWLTECYMFGAVFNPAAEVAAIHDYTSASSRFHEPGPKHIPGTATPLIQSIQWKSSGSKWLDARAARVVLYMRTEAEIPGLWLRLHEGEALRFHEGMTEGNLLEAYFSIVPDTIYQIGAGGMDNVNVQVLVNSFLPFEIIEE